MPLDASKALRMVSICFLASYSITAISNPDHLPVRPAELTSIDLEAEWQPTSHPSFPRDALSVFPKSAKAELTNGPLKFVRVDLDWDGESEIIVADTGASGSGGQAYFILRKYKKAWREIGEFQGGFVLSGLENSNRFYRITSYYRSGDTYQNTYDYQNGRYRLTGQVQIPRVISRSCWWDPFWSRLNGFSVYDGKGRKHDHNPKAVGSCRDPSYR